MYKLPLTLPHPKPFLNGEWLLENIVKWCQTARQIEKYMYGKKLINENKLMEHSEKCIISK